MSRTHLPNLVYSEIDYFFDKKNNKAIKQFHKALSTFSDVIYLHKDKKRLPSRDDKLILMTDYSSKELVERRGTSRAFIHSILETLTSCL